MIILDEEEVDRYLIEKEEDVVWDNIKDDVINKIPGIMNIYLIKKQMKYFQSISVV